MELDLIEDLVHHHLVDFQPSLQKCQCEDRYALLV